MSIIQWFIDTLVTSKKKPIKKYVNVIINGETVKREMGPRGQYKRLPGDPIVINSKGQDRRLTPSPVPKIELIKDKEEDSLKYVNVIINGETVKREMGPRGQYKRLPGDPIVKRDIFSTYYSSKKAQSSNNNSRYISSETKHDVFRISGGRCQKCGSIRNLEYDHIHPFSRGGDNSFNNIQLLCRKCNRKKGGR